ncbi:hypothetical protein LTR82_011393 [Friedmanniomyces endolithicus]|uniref:Uncharacterized protein n=1 Tax=Friedmanniomyces endolithicus TaxID=329885 RepID=A0AAN6FHL9_9PEZI|nr:hypothetical protein LTR82_011393 [Friedmanniomyces endolithicus]
MLFKPATLVWGLAVVSTSASAQRGQRHQRQASPYYGATNSTSTTTSSSHSTSSTSTSTPPSSVAASSTSEVSNSTSRYGSSTSTQSSTSSSLSLSSSSSSSSASPTVYTSSSTAPPSPYSSLPSSPASPVYSSSQTVNSTWSIYSSSQTVNSTLSSSAPSPTYVYSPSTASTSAPSIYSSGAVVNSTSPSSILASAYSASTPATVSSTISTYVTVSTFYSYLPETNTSSTLSASALNSSRSSGTAPSYYGVSPLGPHTASPTATTSSIPPSGYTPVVQNSTSSAGSLNYYRSGSSGPIPTRTPYGSGSYSMNSPYNKTFAYQPSGSLNTASSSYTPPASCHGATLNVLNASLDWWYTSTFTYVASTISVSTNLNGSTGWSVILASTTFDVTSALATPSCTYTIMETAGWQGTYSYYNGTCFRTPTPVAASTTVVSVTAFKPLNQTTGNGTIPDVVTAPRTASVTIPVANNTATTTSAGAYSAGTPFVYFSSYEIVHKKNTTDSNGRAACHAATVTHHMAEPFSFEYAGPEVNGFRVVGANVTGDVNPAFLGVVAQSTAIAGSWVAAPTVVMVVERVLAKQVQQPIGFSAASSITTAVLETITPTLPPGFTSAPAGSLSSIGFTARVQSTQPVLLLPTTTTSSPAAGGGGGGGAPATPTTAAGGNGGNNGGATTAGNGGNNGGANTAGGVAATSAPGLGGLISAVNSAVQATAGGGGGAASSAPGVGGLVSAVNSAVQPTNAVQVFSNAVVQAGNPTASAIVAGLGGSSAQGGGGGSPAGSGSTAGSGSGSGSGSSVVTVGGSAFTVTPVNNGGSSGAVVVAAGGSSATLAPGQSASVGGQTVSAPSSGGVVIGTGSGATTVSPGSSGSGTAGSGAAGGSGTAGSGSSGSQVVAVGGTTFTVTPANNRGASGAVVVAAGGASATLAPGQSASVGGQTVTAPSSGGVVIGSGSGAAVVAPASSSSSTGASSGTGSQVVTVGGSTFTVTPSSNGGASGVVVVAGGSTATLAPGQTATVNGQTVIAPSSGGVVIGTGSGAATVSPAGSGSGSASQVVTVGGATFTVTPSSNGGASGVVVVAGGSTAALAPGQTATVDGQTVTAPSSGGVIIGSGTGAAIVAPVGSISGSGSAGGSGLGSNGGAVVQADNLPAAVITVAGSTATANAAPVFVVDGQTITPGGAPITVGTDTIAVAASATAIIVDGSTLPIAGSIGSSTVFNVNGIPITANPALAFPIAGQTLQAGGAPITVDDTTLSLVPGGTAVVIDGSTSIISHQTPGAAANIPLLTIGSQTFTANAATQFSLAPGETLTPGGVVTVSGTTISLASGASAVVINGQTRNLAAPATTPAPQVTVGGTVYQANAGSTYDIGGQILTPGGVITVSGTTISLAPSATAIVVNGVTTKLGGAAGSQTAPNSNLATITAPPVLTVDGQAFAANGGTSYVISGKTLTAGGAITISGPNGVETISLNAAANEIFSIVSGTTMTSMVGAMGAMPTGAPVLTIDGHTYTAVAYDTGAGPTYVIGGQTLTRGGVITISAPSGGKETISLDSAGTALDIVFQGHTTVSTITGAYAVMPTAAPILTIGGATFTAINNGATYVIDGHTLTPGQVETVIISGHTYIVSLAPQATILMIETEGSDGKVTGTTYETLFPAQMTRGTVTNTIGMATAGGSLSAGVAAATSGSGSAAGLASAAEPSIALRLSAAVVAIGSLVLAVWL